MSTNEVQVDVAATTAATTATTAPVADGAVAVKSSAKNHFMTDALTRLFDPFPHTEMTTPDKRGGKVAALALVVAFVAGIAGAAVINADFALGTSPKLFTTDSTAWAHATSKLCFLPAIAAFVNLTVQYALIKCTVFEAYTQFTTVPPRPAWTLIILLMVVVVYDALSNVVVVPTGLAGVSSEHNSHFLLFVMQRAIAAYVLWIFFDLVAIADAYFEHLVTRERAIYSTSTVTKMQTILKAVTAHGKPAKDAMYSCYGDGETSRAPGPMDGAASRLQQLWSLSTLVLRASMSLLFLAYVLHLDSAALGIGAGLLLFIITGVVSAGFCLADSAMGLLRIALYRPYYVGDIVQFTSTGSDSGVTVTTGFVEAITLFGIVVRNFSMMQTWVSHAQASQSVVLNWSRRPTKTVLLDMAISSNCSVAAVEALVKFGQTWLKASKEVDQGLYQKCVLASVDQGMTINAIWFPAPGVSHKKVRQKFLLAFMKTAEALQVQFVPMTMSQMFPGRDGRESAPRAKKDLVQDLSMFMPSD